MNGNLLGLSLNYKNVRAYASDIYIAQQVESPMWINCVVNRKSFRTVCSEYNNNLNLMIKDGLNCNMFTRKRWLDITFISKGLKMTGVEFIKLFDISSKQYYDWSLSKSEMIDFNINLKNVHEIYGKPTFINEYVRLGKEDLRVALSNTKLYGIDNNFLYQFGDEQSLTVLGWKKYFMKKTNNNNINQNIFNSEQNKKDKFIIPILN